MRLVPWAGPLGGLAADDPGRTDAAFVWLPLPDPEHHDWFEVKTEPRVVALPATHPLATRHDLDIEDLLLALPAESRALRDY
ncbi:MAG TPA: hypothetical protein VNO83_16845 [Pseudonocardia sp.]|nr:hypothetical protein [Pseudonocardia sp.]